MAQRDPVGDSCQVALSLFSSSWFFSLRLKAFAEYLECFWGSWDSFMALTDIHISWNFSLIGIFFFFFSPPRTFCFFSLKVRASWTQFLTLVPFSEINLDVFSLYSLQKECMFQIEQSSEYMIIFYIVLCLYIAYFMREKVDLFIPLYT